MDTEPGGGWRCACERENLKVVATCLACGASREPAPGPDPATAVTVAATAPDPATAVTVAAAAPATAPAVVAPAPVAAPLVDAPAAPQVVVPPSSRFRRFEAAPARVEGKVARSGDRAFAEIALGQGLVTEEQLAKARREVQDREYGGEVVELADALMARGLMTGAARLAIEKQRDLCGRACAACGRTTYLLPGERARTVPCERCGGSLVEDESLAPAAEAYRDLDGRLGAVRASNEAAQARVQAAAGAPLEPASSLPDRSAPRRFTPPRGGEWASVVVGIASVRVPDTCACCLGGSEAEFTVRALYGFSWVATLVGGHGAAEYTAWTFPCCWGCRLHILVDRIARAVGVVLAGALIFAAPFAARAALGRTAEAERLGAAVLALAPAFALFLGARGLGRALAPRGRSCATSGTPVAIRHDLHGGGRVSFANADYARAFAAENEG